MGLDGVDESRDCFGEEGVVEVWGSRHAVEGAGMVVDALRCRVDGHAHAHAHGEKAVVV